MSFGISKEPVNSYPSNMLGQKLNVGTYTSIDGQPEIKGTVTKTGIKSKGEAVAEAMNDDRWQRNWLGVSEPTHTAIYKDKDGTYSLLKVDKDYTQSVAYGEYARSQGQANANFEFID